MNGKRLGTLLLAGSLGLNVALGGILLYQAVAGGKETSRLESDQWRRRADWRERPEWQSRFRSMPDSTSPPPRLQYSQINRLREMRRDLEEVISPLRTEINALQALTREELGKPQPDIARLDSTAAEIARLQSHVQQHLLRLILREREILTPEQYQSFMRMMMPGQFGPRETGRFRPMGPSDRDTTRGQHRSSRGFRGPTDVPPPA